MEGENMHFGTGADVRCERTSSWLERWDILAGQVEARERLIYHVVQG